MVTFKAVYVTDLYVNSYTAALTVKMLLSTEFAHI